MPSRFDFCVFSTAYCTVSAFIRRWAATSSPPLPRQAAIVRTRLAFELPHIAGKDSNGSKLSEANQGDGGNPPTLS
jgi:hypothetical protein